MKAPTLVGSALSHPCVTLDSEPLGLVFKKMLRPSFPRYISSYQGNKSVQNA